ncbi:sensor histidine kinase [Nonomuraea sp. NBC_01738]|uniref:sensor histidine kinase n=1 Tax=Nonomuraea sp. NBC_01738 TaxID=2976003 RepID=UPI002E0FB8B4|nr:sensor histidine kinase [Nonomuraea sp. NBC_01738]
MTAGLTLLLGGLVVVGQVTGAGGDSGPAAALAAPVALAFTPMGALILAGVRGAAVGRLMLATGLVAAGGLMAASWSVWLPAHWVTQWAGWPPFALIFLTLLVFPDGRLPSPRWRPLAVWIAVTAAVATVAFAVAAFDHPRTLLTEIDTPLTARAQTLLRIGGVAVLTSVAGLAGVLWSLWCRWQRADGEVRLQLMCLLPAGGLFVVGLALSVEGVSGGWALGAVAVPIAMTVAVLRYHLYDLDQIVNRAVVWLVMTVLIVAAFVGIVAAVRVVLFHADATQASLVATGLIAASFEPLRRRVQSGVDRLLYGDRDDPYKIVAQLGKVVGSTAEPNAVLPQLTAAVARSLRVPYVAIELAEGGSHIAAEHGSVPPDVQPFELVAHGETIGRLLVATRTRGSRFSRRDMRLLRDIAVHAAVAAEGTKLVRDLRRSRERLVLAREEERRRLRRELHDSVGPSLSGMSMQLRAARKALPDDSPTGAMLTVLADDLRNCTIEVRQLVDQLRPPALDNGLGPGLRAECRRFDGTDLSVDLRVTGDLDGLPAAVEVAVYRIVAEALANVVRHAHARRCTVAVQRSYALAVDVTDDGTGIDGGSPRGVGLDSMKERAAELGGTFLVRPAPSSGTVVSIRIPLRTAGPA